MSNVKLVRRMAGRIMGRGQSSVRIKPSAMEDVKNVLTRDDVRTLIKDGKLYAVQEKHNLSRYGKMLREKRQEGRGRGIGRRRGTAKARQGNMDHKKRVRAQRRLLAMLKDEKTINNEQFKQLYALVSGGTFNSKVSLLTKIKSSGVEISEEKYEKLRHI
jgi:large subunit ribosomal protein L19e